MPASASLALWSLLILALIPLALWLLRRSGVAGGGAPDLTRIVASTTLGPGQRLVTVEVGQGEQRRWLVLGATAQHISLLHSLPAPPEAALPAQSGAAPSFAELVHRLRRAGAGRGGAR